MNSLADFLAWAGGRIARAVARLSAPGRSRISYERLARAVCDALRDNRDEIGRRVLLPNIVHLYCSPEDREIRKSFEGILIGELREELAGRAHEWDPNVTASFFRLELHTDESLRPGECAADCFFDYSERGASRHAPAAPMATLIEEGPGEESPEPAPAPPGDRPRRTGSPDGFQPLVDDEYYRKECRLWKPWKEGKAGCMIKITGPGKSESRIAPAGRWYIGRGKACQIVLDGGDKSISRRHVEVEVQASGIRLKCLGLNGALMNDRELPPDEWVSAMPGDSLFIGRYELKLSKARIA